MKYLLKVSIGGHDQYGIYLFKANNKKTRTMCEICAKLKIFEHNSHIILMFPLLALNKSTLADERMWI